MPADRAHRSTTVPVMPPAAWMTWSRMAHFATESVRWPEGRSSPSAHTSPPAVEIGTPIQKPQPAQLASHHDMSSPNSVTAPMSASEAMDRVHAFEDHEAWPAIGQGNAASM
jgi:hypothetical protein